MPEASSPRRYLLVCGWLTGAVLGGLAGFNWLIDPYGAFGAPSIAGVNSIKYGFNNHLRLAKAYAVKTARPATVILGSSRAETSLDPAHPGFRQRPAYNLALSGAGIYELYRYLQHAQAVGPLREVVLVLDFYMFNGDWRPQADFSEARLAVAPDGQPTPHYAGEISALLLSAGAARDSWWSLRHQGSGAPSYLSNGLRDGRLDLPTILGSGGHRKAFLANEEYFFRFGYSPGGRGYQPLDRDGRSPFEWLARMLDFCGTHGIALHAVISPIHARQHQVIATAGLWPRYEEWKRQLVATFAADGAHRRSAPYPLWDFGAINDITTEPVPAAGDTTTAMRWYRESSHYRETLGALMLDRVLASPADYREPADGFGLALTPENVEAQLVRQRARFAAWQAAHAEDVAEIEAIPRGVKPRP